MGFFPGKNPQQIPVKLRNIRSPGGIYGGLFPGKKPYFSFKNPKLSQRCTFFPQSQDSQFFAKSQFLFGKFPKKFLSSRTLLPPAELHHFSGKTDLSKSSLSILVLYLVILVVKGEFSMYSFEDCTLQIPSYMVENPRPRALKSQEPRQCPARDLNLRRIL